MKMTITLILTFAFFVTHLNAQTFCDDFNSDSPWANLTSVSTPGIIGHTQNNSQAVTLLSGGVDFNTHSGMYGTGDVTFNFNGNNQLVNFQVYYLTGQENQFQVAVNGSAFSPVSNFFTSSSLGGVMVSFDSTLANTSASGFNDALLAFNGNLNTITVRFFESGINELCTDESPHPYFGCDDFENDSIWTNQSNFTTPGIIGYTQNNTQAVTLVSGGVDFNTHPGMYGTGDVNFDFNGSSQIVNFHTYYLTGQENQFQVSVNGSVFTPISNFFTSSLLSGVQVYMDSTVINNSVAGFNDALLMFNGIITTITVRFFESGISQLCIDAHTAGITDPEKELEFSLFPNPASEQVTLSEVAFDYLVISDNSGRIVKTQHASEGKTIRLENFSNGVYQLSVVSKNQVGKKRFVVSN